MSPIRIMTQRKLEEIAKAIDDNFKEINDRITKLEDNFKKFVEHVNRKFKE